MLKKFLVLAFSALFALALLPACGKSKKEREAEEQKARDWEISNFSEGKSEPPKPKALPKEQVVVVPEAVKAKYKTVLMGVGNRKTKEIKKFTVRIGETAAVPGTDYKVKVTEYLPHWVFRGNKVTSEGDKPVDPAVRATIYEGDRQVFDGYIFQKHKTPSFMTDEYIIGLIGTEAK